jgi:hypothetical protein
MRRQRVVDGASKGVEVDCQQLMLWSRSADSLVSARSLFEDHFATLVNGGSGATYRVC